MAKPERKAKPVLEKDAAKGGFLRDLFGSKGGKSKHTSLVPARQPVTGSASDRYGRAPKQVIEDSRMTAAIEPSSESQSESKPTAKTAQRAAPRLEQKTDHRTAELNPPSKKKKIRLETIRVQETIIGPRDSAGKPDVTSASQLKNKTRTDIDITKTRKTKSSNPARYLLVVIAIVAIGYAAKMQMSADAERAAAAMAEPDIPAELMKDRVAFYRNETGRRLNRERMDVQYHKQIDSPNLPERLKKMPEQDMMAGVPLQEEQHPRERSRDSHEQGNPVYADTYIQMSLREQQDANEWEKVAQKQYVDEFIANAAKAGYKVKVDKSGNVHVVGRLPASGQAAGAQNGNGRSGDSGPSGGGSIR